MALQDMYEAQKQMEQWAVSKNKPGQFLGSTGARVLPKHEFNTGVQAYAKKEQFTKAERVGQGCSFKIYKMTWLVPVYPPLPLYLLLCNRIS